MDSLPPGPATDLDLRHVKICGMAQLVVRIGHQIDADLEGHPLSFTTRQEGLLLAALALADGQELSRRQLAAQLWPEKSLSAALTNLRQRVAALRRHLGGLLYIDRDWIAVTGVSCEVLLDASSPHSLVAQCQQLAQRADADTVQGTKPWSRADLQNWVDATIRLQAPAREPQMADMFTLRGQCDDEQLDAEYRLLVNCLVGYWEVQRGQALWAWQRLRKPPRVWLHDPALGSALALLFEIAGNGLHRRGHWHQCLLCFTKAAELFRTNGQDARALMLEFKTARVTMDVGLRAPALQRLQEVRAHPTVDDQPLMRAYIDLNLVFAHTICGQTSEAHRIFAAATRSQHHHAAITDSWMFLNACTMFCQMGDRKRAVECLHHADQAYPDDAQPLDRQWIWYRAAEILSYADRDESAILVDALARRATMMAQNVISPLNVQRIEEIIHPSISRISTSQWLALVHKSERQDMTEAHATVMEHLAALA